VHISLLDVYKPGQGIIHRLDPRVKILGIILYILTTLSIPQDAWFAYAFLWLGLLLLSWAAGLGVFFTVRRAVVALPFLLAAVPLPFLIPGPTLWVIPGLDWVVTLPGLIRFLSILIRTWIAVQAGILLSATTQVPDLLWGMKALGIPRMLVSIVGFMIRYLFVLADEALRMLRARAARSPRLPGNRRPGVLWQARVAGLMVGSLFLRSLERSERVHAAMLSRGYDGEMRMMTRPKMEALDWFALIGLITLLVILSIWSVISNASYG
jgi:cobalt/nickel transport system permease protein